MLFREPLSGLLSKSAKACLRAYATRYYGCIYASITSSSSVLQVSIWTTLVVPSYIYTGFQRGTFQSHIAFVPFLCSIFILAPKARGVRARANCLLNSLSPVYILGYFPLLTLTLKTYSNVGSL